MCGIAGGINLGEGAVHKMNKALAHRGPDGNGLFRHKNVTLGHTRLAIIDVSENGAQPMRYQTTDGYELIVTFNGEIYNYLELKDELVSLGYSFATESDTEVILVAYAAWGKQCVKKFNGMWAFCILDTKTEELFLSRDRLGLKPLYYSQAGEVFSFASELKSLLAGRPEAAPHPPLSKLAIELFFSLGYIPAPHTIYETVEQLPPAHTLTVSLATGAIAVERYWELPDFTPCTDRQKVLQEGKRLLADATGLRMRADVPVGAFLSGGLDSTSVVATMRKYTSLDKLHTFSIGFSGQYDESTYAAEAATAFGTLHHHRYFEEENFLRQLDSFGEIFDEPFSDHSGFPTEFVSELARQHVTVALSGDGGDEVFGGYGSHQLGARFDVLRRVPRLFRRLLAVIPVSKKGGRAPGRSLVLACRLSLLPPEEFVAEASFGDTLRTPAAKEWLRQSFAASYQKSGGSMAEALRIFDVLYNTLPHKYLTKVDRASMHHSLEVRSPFLDYRFFEYAQTIPTNWKLSVRRGKLMLGELVKEIVPDSIISRKKQGFEPPVYDWLRDPKHEAVLTHGLKNLTTLAPEVAAWYQKYDHLSHVDSKHLFRLFAFQLWWKVWMKNNVHSN